MSRTLKTTIRASSIATYYEPSKDFYKGCSSRSSPFIFETFKISIRDKHGFISGVGVERKISNILHLEELEKLSESVFHYDNFDCFTITNVKVFGLNNQEEYSGVLSRRQEQFKSLVHPSYIGTSEDDGNWSEPFRSNGLGIFNGAYRISNVTTKTVNELYERLATTLGEELAKEIIVRHLYIGALLSVNKHNAEDIASMQYDVWGSW